MRKRMSDDSKVFVMISGRMGLPPSEMGKSEGEACLRRKIGIFTSEQAVFGLSTR